MVTMLKTLNGVKVGRKWIDDYQTIYLWCWLFKKSVYTIFFFFFSLSSTNFLSSTFNLIKLPSVEK